MGCFLKVIVVSTILTSLALASDVGGFAGSCMQGQEEFDETSLVQIKSSVLPKAHSAHAHSAAASDKEDDYGAVGTQTRSSAAELEATQEMLEDEDEEDDEGLDEDDEGVGEGKKEGDDAKAGGAKAGDAKAGGQRSIFGTYVTAKKDEYITAAKAGTAAYKGYLDAKTEDIKNKVNSDEDIFRSYYDEGGAAKPAAKAL